MFNNSKKAASQDERRGPAENTLSIIAPGAVIDGNVYSEGDIRVEGKIIGTLSCRSRVVVGAQGTVEGNIDALNATVAGTVHGTVIVREMLQLAETGKVYGDIVTVKIAIQPGGLFTGMMKMGPDAADLMKRNPQPTIANIKPVLLNTPTQETPAS